jgi:biotin carboxylase
MHIAFVDSNPAALDAIKCAKEESHRVSYIQSLDPIYLPSRRNQELIDHADWVKNGIATTDADAVRAVLAECHAQHPIDFVTTQDEMVIESVALACRELGLPCTNPDAVLTTRRKDLLRAALRKAGLPTAEHAVAGNAAEARSAAESIGFPVVIKPPSGTDSRLVFVARDQADVQAACDQAALDLDALPLVWRSQFSRGFLIEEHLDGPLVSAEIGMRDERGFLFCVSGRSRARDDEVFEVGAHIPAGLTPEQATACGQYAEAVCRAVGLDRGLFHLEMILTARGPVLVEANPRVMGGILPTVYRLATGHSIYCGFLQIVSGAPVTGTGHVFSDCVAVRRLLAHSAGQIPASWDSGSLGRCDPPPIRFEGPESFGLRPGQQVHRGQMIGRAIVRGADYTATTRASREIVQVAEKLLGIELMYGEYDDEP